MTYRFTVYGPRSDGRNGRTKRVVENGANAMMPLLLNPGNREGGVWV